MFESNTPFTMPVMPATGGYDNGGAWGDGGWLCRISSYTGRHPAWI